MTNEVHKIFFTFKNPSCASGNCFVITSFENSCAFVSSSRQTLTTTGEPCVFTQGSPVVVNVWREDEIKVQEFSKEVITKQFPDAQDGFLKVKKIL